MVRAAVLALALVSSAACADDTKMPEVFRGTWCYVERNTFVEYERFPTQCREPEIIRKINVRGFGIADGYCAPVKVKTGGNGVFRLTLGCVYDTGAYQVHVERWKLDGGKLTIGK